MDDPYETLGVARDATDDAIRTAYRKLAKRYHPDVNSGRADATERFKSITTAHDLLSDPVKRARFDRGEIDAMGNEVPPQRPFRGGGRARHPDDLGGEVGIDPEELAELFGFNARRGRGRSRGADAHYALSVDFLDAANGAVRRLDLPTGRQLDVTIPPGTVTGTVLRLKGHGEPGTGRGHAGDALIEITVAPHPLFRREGDDVIVTLPVTITEAVLGAGVPVPTLTGQVRMTIPPHSSTGTRLRLKGRGIAGGHQFVELKIMVPPEPEPALEEFLRGWTPAHPFDPRA